MLGGGGGDMNMSTLPRSFLARRTNSFTPSPIQQLSRLAEERNAINLAEGFPDFSAPLHLKQAAIAAISLDCNQYRHVPALCELVARLFSSHQDVDVDPQNVIVCCGQSEAFAASILAVVDENDEVLVLDPAYETYGACITMAGGIPVYIEMEPPFWNLDLGKVEASINNNTKAIVINSPHNPTGKVFSKQELSHIAALCVKYNILAITDEVYEHITFESAKHISLASFAGMLERTIVTSSISKTYSVTGWRIGWAIAPADIASAIKNIHIKITDSAPAPFQEAAIAALESSESYYTTLKMEYEQRCNLVCTMLQKAGLSLLFRPQGSFFVFAKLPESYKKSDVEFVAELIEKAGVAVVPGCGFFHENKTCANHDASSCEATAGLGESLGCIKSNGYRRRYVRVAFCKNMSTLMDAAEAMLKCCIC